MYGEQFKRRLPSDTYSSHPLTISTLSKADRGFSARVGIPWLVKMPESGPTESQRWVDTGPMALVTDKAL